MSDEELRVCPFCGCGRVEVRRSDGEENGLGVDMFAVQCGDCDIEGPWGDDEATAREAWNRRASEPAWIAAAERLPEELQYVLAADIHSDWEPPMFLAYRSDIRPPDRWIHVIDGGTIAVTHWMPLPAPPSKAKPAG